jgi:hypothetical protein
MTAMTVKIDVFFAIIVLPPGPSSLDAINADVIEQRMNARFDIGANTPIAGMAGQASFRPKPDIPITAALLPYRAGYDGLVGIAKIPVVRRRICATQNRTFVQAGSR